MQQQHQTRIRHYGDRHQNHHHLLPWKLTTYVRLFVVTIVIVWVTAMVIMIRTTTSLSSSSSSSSSRDLQSAGTSSENGHHNNNNADSDVRQSCKYNGNCPHHTVCEDGLCLPYFDQSSKDKQKGQDEDHDNCVKKCWKELEADEHWYFEASAKMLYTYTALNGHGCIIDYERDLNPTSKKDFGTVEDWMQNRFRYVVRVDPILTPKGSLTSTWRALCDWPCNSDAQCPSGTVCVGRPEHDAPTPVIKSDPFTCQKKSTVQSLLPAKNDAVIVSGADYGYFSKMKHMAASLQYWAPEKKLVVYNLGLKPEQVKEARSWSNVIDVKWPDGIPAWYPNHVHVGKKYAWKAIAINETVYEYKSIFWWDGGSVFAGPLWPIDEILHRQGIFLVHGQDEDMKAYSHKDTYKWFGYDKDQFRNGIPSPHCGGGTQGHVYPSRFYDTIVKPWAECAMDVSCIAPPGSKLSNHRYDQTAVSILSYQEHVQAPHFTEYVAADKKQLSKDLDKPSHRMFLWTARGSSTHYGNPTVKK
jgi:hypothetical protein